MESASDAFVAPIDGWDLAAPEARADPITGLLAYPDFDRLAADWICGWLRAGEDVAIAIGDVDDLRGHVENMRCRDPRHFGHVAGNAVMRGVGAATRSWLVNASSVIRGVASTFGGDEVIIVATVTERESFIADVGRLQSEIAAALPRTLSFAYCCLSGPLVDDRLLEPERDVFEALMFVVDRTLLAAKTSQSGRRLMVSVHGEDGSLAPSLASARRLTGSATDTHAD